MRTNDIFRARMGFILCYRSFNIDVYFITKQRIEKIVILNLFQDLMGFRSYFRC